MPEEHRNDILEIRITALHAVCIKIIKIKQKHKFENVDCALSPTEGPCYTHFTMLKLIFPSMTHPG